jgi:AbrB family looped-hinge helix DNA binding protein
MEHAELSTTKMTSRGQVVIPEAVRDALRLREGDHFAVIARGGVVILKRVTENLFGAAAELLPPEK